MFTGIIKAKGKIIAIAEGNNSRRITMVTDIDGSALQLGASVACDGWCLTVVEKTQDTLTFDVAAETMALTTLKHWDIDTAVNLETSLRLGDELGGHMVSGHVDGIAVVESVRPDGDSWRFKIRVPDRLAQYISPKGSVALNGISLTVNEVEGSVFGICIIPHTWDVTNIHLWDEGTQINLEVDQLARYVARILGRDAA
ncbi:MAG: riboflavin synthase [Alphaproteobacteria bacterium]|nr:riboflavin synthase [Alphaproteobacteria bacterium]